MVRLQHRVEITYGHFGEFIVGIEEVNRLLRARGLAEFVPWTPMSGKVNEVVLISDYSDLATFKQQEGAFYGDAEVMSQWRKLAGLLVQGSGTIELLEPAPLLAP